MIELRLSAKELIRLEDPETLFSFFTIFESFSEIPICSELNSSLIRAKASLISSTLSASLTLFSISSRSILSRSILLNSLNK
jgi:hypothetical protein